MNSLIETLNVWGDHALRLAWPMLWQSTLLIGALFALDWLLRRKLRPAVRYALWLVVLVKLVVPPSLAFPTSAGWWLRPTTHAAPPRQLARVVVTYGPSDVPVIPATTAPVFVAPPPPRLSPSAWALVGTAAVSLGLLAWMLARWRQVACDARRAALAPAGVTHLLPELAHRSRLKLIDRPQSPAVCGLFRPVILLPRSLVGQLPPAQLRAVLLHELFHLRRGDVWVNCAQALLQIAYWWHPLVWLANARIRRVREEAVDDAVMLALNEEAETYAPTLLEVARLSLHRPLATLGLVGILESRSALRQRIERLMDFHPPRKAGLGLASILGVLGFAALAVPMAEAPAPTSGSAPVAPQVATNSSLAPTNAREAIMKADNDAVVSSTNTVSGAPPLYIRTFKVDTNALLEALQVPKGPVGTNGTESIVPALLNYFARAGVDLDPTRNPGKSLFYKDRQGMFIVRATLQDLDNIERLLSKLNTAPPRTPQLRNQGSTSAGRQALIRKLEQIRLESISFDALPLGEVVRVLGDEVRKRDPEKRGINFIVQSVEEETAALAPTLDPQTGLPAPPAKREALSAVVINLKYPMTDLRVADVLDAIVKVAARPIKYSIEDYGIVFSAKTAQEIRPLYIRTFKVDPNTLLNSLHLREEAPSARIITNIEKQWMEKVNAALRDHFAKLGADLDPTRNPGKAIFLNDRQGMLIVRGTLADLDIVEAAIQVLNVTPPQINIKARFVEISQDDGKALGFDWYLGNVLLTNGASGGQVGVAPASNAVPSAANPTGVFPGQPAAAGATNSSFPLTGILTDPQYRVILKALQQRQGAELIAQPEVTTISGRQAQCKAVDIRTIVQGVDERALNPPGITGTNDTESAVLKTEQMELGPVLDIIPTVLPDGYTINLWVYPTLTEFLGYENNRTNRVTVYLNGKPRQVTPPQPVFRVCQMQSSVNVWDGQTLVLGGLVSEQVTSTKSSMPALGSLPLVGKLFRSESKSAQKRQLLVFITPTIVDPAGNLVHSGEEMPFSIKATPPQPKR